MEKPSERDWVGPKIVRAQKLVWGRANCVSYVVRDSDMALAGCHRKGTMALPAFCVGESCRSSSCLISHSSVPPLMSLVPLGLLPQHWSSGHPRLSKFMCWPFKRHHWDSRSPHLRWPQSALVLQSEVMRPSLHATESLGWEANVGLRPLAP